MLNNGKFICTCCTYITYNIGNYNRHLKSNKHIKKDSLDKMVGKNKNDLLHKTINLGKYICLKCKYITSICSNYYRHTRTKKHLSNETNIIEKTYECVNCKFKSKYKSNYKRHLRSKKHLTTINNSNKPLNFSEFSKLINIEMSDIEMIITMGLINFIVNKVKTIYLDIKIKPIYCNDFKRKKFMIYENNEWLLVNKNILNIIVDEIQKNILEHINKWKKENKSNYSIERLNEIYLHIINICSVNLINNKVFVNDICRVFKYN